MNLPVQFLVNHGMVVLFGTVLAEQAGLPVPSVPMLLWVGSVASLGHTNLAVSIAVAFFACLTADSAWYEVGRRRRGDLLRKYAAKSVRSTPRIGNKLVALNGCGLGALVLGKFLPGPNLVTPFAGISGLTRARFLIFDSVASVVWAGSYITIGYIFKSRLESIAANGSRVGFVLIVVVICSFAAWALIRYGRRHRSHWRLQTTQIPSAD